MQNTTTQNKIKVFTRNYPIADIVRNDKPGTTVSGVLKGLQTAQKFIAIGKEASEKANNDASDLDSIKQEFGDLAEFNKAYSCTAKTWENALKIYQAEQVRLMQDGATTDDTQAKEDKATVWAEPSGLLADLGKYANLREALKTGVQSKETFNDAIMHALAKLYKSKNKDFRLIKAVLWLMATEPSFSAEFKQVQNFIKSVTPFTVISRPKKSELPDGRIEKVTVIKLVKTNGQIWRKRPSKFWNKVADKNTTEKPTLTKDKALAKISKVAEEFADATEAKTMAQDDVMTVLASLAEQCGHTDIAGIISEIRMAGDDFAGLQVLRKSDRKFSEHYEAEDAGESGDESLEPESSNDTK